MKTDPVQRPPSDGAERMTNLSPPDGPDYSDVVDMLHAAEQERERLTSELRAARTGLTATMNEAEAERAEFLAKLAAAERERDEARKETQAWAHTSDMNLTAALKNYDRAKEAEADLAAARSRIAALEEGAE